MKVLFLTKYGMLGASSRYRTLQYVPFLESQGIECQISPLFADVYLKNKYEYGRYRFLDALRCLTQRLMKPSIMRKFDLIVIEKEMIPYMPLFLEKQMYPGSIPYVLDYDDAIFHNYDSSPSWIVRTLLSRKIPSLMREAHAVISGNNYITEFANRAGARVIQIPTVVNLERYPVQKEEEPDIFTIGWVGSPSTSLYILEIIPVLERFCADHRCRIKLLGFDAKLADRMKNLPVEIIVWSEATEVSEMKGFTIGIMPLPDTPWTRGKCGLKLLQYMGSFLPVLASPVGVNSEIVDHGVNGFLSTGPDQWHAHLNELYEQAQLRHTMGMKGRERVESTYHLGITRGKYLDTLKTAVV